VEKISGDQSHPDHLAAVVADQARALHALAGEPRKNRVPIAQREINRMGEGMHTVAAVRAKTPALDPQLDELTRITHRQQSQHDLIEKREDRRISANPKRE